MKVLFVQNIAAIAGSENYMLALFPGLVRHGINVHFLNIYLQGDEKVAKEYGAMVEDCGVEVHYLSIRRYQTIKPAFKIASIVKLKNIDIVHSHLIYSDFWNGIAKRLSGVRFKGVSTLHAYQEDLYVKHCLHPEKLPHTLYYYLQKFVNNSLDAIYACSYGLREFYIGAGLQSKNGIEVIQHGFDYRKMDNDWGKYRMGQYQLCVVGRLIERKGHAFLLKALPEIIKSYPDLKLVIAGSGEEEHKLKALVKEQNLSSQVEFLGYDPNTLEIMKASDVVVVPSYAEGLPLVIFEAFQSETPVVAFNTIGCGEAIEHGISGLLVEPYDSKQLAREVIKLLDSNEMRETIGKNGKKSLQAHFNLSRMTAETIAFYEKLVRNTDS